MSKLFFLCMVLFATVAGADEVVKLGTANTVNLRGPIDDKSGQDAAMELIRLNNLRGDKGYTIYLVVDSPGGSIDAGEAFIEVAKTIPNLKTVTVFAASMASAIVQALPGERLVLFSGVQMFHRARGGVQGQFETGELETRLEFYKRFVRRMEARNASRMGLNLKQYKALVKDEYWISGEDVVGVGADRIVALQCSDALIEKKQSVAFEVFIFQITLEYSGCPLLRTPSVAPQNSAESVQAYKKFKMTERPALYKY
jgi:ATP-dependent protease ClpP protease subunit